MGSATSTERKPRKGIKVGEVLDVLVKRVRPFPNQPRVYFDPKGLEDLAESIKANGQITPVSVIRVDDSDECDFELIDGQRRWYAIQIANKKEIRVIVEDSTKITSSFDQYRISVISNFGRADHTPGEIAHAIERFRDEGESIDNIAKIFARSRTWVEQHLKILKLIPEVLEMMDPELPKEKQLRYSVALDIADLPENHQLTIAKIIIKKEMKLYEARNYIRNEAERRGISSRAGKRPRVPADDYKNLNSLIHRSENTLGSFAEKDQAFFDALFQNRSEEDPVYLCDTILRVTEYLNSISEKTKQALAKKKAQ